MTMATVPYIDDGLARHLLDVHLPAEPAGAAVVMVIHGGSLRKLSKERMAGCSGQLARAGFVAVAPNYRLLDQADYPAPVDDVLAAFEWVRTGPPALGGADVSRVGVLGASAGSYLAQMMAAAVGASGLRCVVAVSGPSDVVHELPDGSRHCPLERVSPDWPPVLITHNRNDGIVSAAHAEKLHAALGRSGVANELFLYSRSETDHGIWAPGADPPEFLDFLQQRYDAFLSRHLAP